MLVDCIQFLKSEVVQTGNKRSMFSWNNDAEDFTKEIDLVKILARQLTFDLYNCKNSKLREVWMRLRESCRGAP